jgi:hypothetical protein
MFVKQLIGRQAGMVIDMGYEEAKACIDNGTAQRATEQEITDVMNATTAPVESIRPEELIAGYRMEAADDGSGFHVFDPGGVRLTGKDDQPIPRNHLEAQQFMRDYALRTRGLPEDKKPEDDGSSKPDAEVVDYKKNTVEELQAMAAARNLDTSGATKKADWIALLERDDRVQKALADIDYDVLTVPELKKVAADRKIDLGTSTDKAEIIAKIKAAPATA